MPDHPARAWNAETFRDQLYIEILDVNDEHEYYIVDEARDTFKEILRDALPSSFVTSRDRDNSNWFGHGFSVDTGSLFSNHQVIVTWDLSGETWNQGVGVVVNPLAYSGDRQYGGLAERAAALTFERIKKVLLAAYPNKVRMRTSAWTSALLKEAA